MREPTFEIDGWCLEDGEERHLAAPDTFWLPARALREGLQPGDFAKLIFRIAIDNEEEPETTERMWVIVRERVPGGYLGILDNDPSSIEQNDLFWRGIELPFDARHIIDVDAGNEDSAAHVSQTPRRRWQPP